jgi:type IV pilus assembly protein PilY1
MMLCGPITVHAQSIADYTAMHPFTSTSLPPNILLLLDNSGSMNLAAYPNAFDPAKTYNGLFDPKNCYNYVGGTFRPNTTPAPYPCPASYPWDGGLLNYVASRRIDMAHYAMTGGHCLVARDAQNGCSQMGGQTAFSWEDDEQQMIPTAQVTGRMPAALVPASANVYFTMIGGAWWSTGTLCVGDDPTVPSGPTCNDPVPVSGYTRTQVAINITPVQPAMGVLQQVGSKARWGLMVFNDGVTPPGGSVLTPIGGNLTTMITQIDAQAANTWTPSAESLYEAVRYFAQIPPAYASTDYTYTDPTLDPYYFAAPTWTSTAQTVPCCQSFILFFTDGLPTQDTQVPTSLQDFAHVAASHGTSDHCGLAAGCSSYYSSHGNPSAPLHLAITEHHDNCSLYYGNNLNTDPCNYNGSHFFDDVAYYAHTTDLRQPTLPVLGEAGNDLPGVQNLTIYTFLAFAGSVSGGGSAIMQAAAKVGAFTDLNGNNLPDLPQEWDQIINATGAAGSDGIPDTYFESSDAAFLRTRLLAAITQMLQQSASATSAAVVTPSTSGAGVSYQAYFYPVQYDGYNQIKWTGYLQSLFVDEFGNFREDTNGDGRLTYKDDNIVKTRFDPTTNSVKVDKYRDTLGNGTANPSTPFVTVALSSVNTLWEAGNRLALTDPSARTILTWVDANNNGIVDAGEQIPFTIANNTTLAPYLRAAAAPSPFTADNLINFVQGTQVAGLRNRQITLAGSPQVWKLGDIINSTPTVVGAPRERFDVLYGDASYSAYYQQYKNQRQVIYAGANDGMLHAFSGGFYHPGDDPTTPSVIEHGWFTRTSTDNSGGPLLGQELWGFIPYQLLPHLQFLADPQYTHVYFVDLKPKVTDARIFTPDADHPNGWGRILIGGFRLGGSCGACVAATGAPPMTVTANFGSGIQTRTFYSAYFVLDITNPEKPPVLLWSFSDPTLGLATTYPTIVRVNPTTDAKTSNTNAKWLLVVGSGPTGYDGSSAQTSTFFAINLQTGPTSGNVFSFPTGDANSFMGDLISVDANLDYRADVVYAGNQIKTGSVPSWAGKLYRLTTGSAMPFGGSTNPTTWGLLSGSNRVPTVLLATFPPAGTTQVGPITAAPSAVTDDASNLWVFFGTGRYYGTADKSNTDTQYLFGVKDSVLMGGCIQSSVTSCQKNNLVNVSSAVICKVCGVSPQVSGVTGVTTFAGAGATSLMGLVQSMDGWYTTLPTAGERSLSAPTVLGGTAFFTTFVPSTTALCTQAGNGNLYALFYKTGTAYTDPIIGTSAAGASNRSISLGSGVPSQMVLQIGAQGSGAAGTTGGSAGCAGQVTGMVQTGSGSTVQICTKPALAVWSRYLSWSDNRN